MQYLTLLIGCATREICTAMLETTDGDIRTMALARIKALDIIQNEAQTEIYTKTPPGMVHAWELQDWWYENHGTVSINLIDFHKIAENKKQEWYAYMDAETNNIL